MTWDFFVFLLALFLNCFRYYCSVFVNFPSSLCSVRAASTQWGPVRKRNWRAHVPSRKSFIFTSAAAVRERPWSLMPSRLLPGAACRQWPPSPAEPRASVRSGSCAVGAPARRLPLEGPGAAGRVRRGACPPSLSSGSVHPTVGTSRGGHKVTDLTLSQCSEL